jgi:hypothetical protein
MKYLKTKNISKHSVSDRSFIIEQPSGKITTNSQDSIKIVSNELSIMEIKQNKLIRTIKSIMKNILILIII